MNGFGCAINYGLKSVAWFAFVEPLTFMPLALASGWWRKYDEPRIHSAFVLGQK